MSWSDPARRFEPAEDRALRDELSELLGVPGGPCNFFDTQATPEIVALAEKLRGEAERRRHTSRKRPAWMLIAAALPFALAVAGLGNWGVQQKHRADEAHVRALQASEAAKVQADELRRVTRESSQAELQRDREGQRAIPATRPASKTARKARPADAELVIPVENPLRTPSLEAQRVKAQGQ
jgi:hypothetical protein